MVFLELAVGPLGPLIVQHLTVADRARLALTCRAGRGGAGGASGAGAEAAAREPSFNTWLLQHIASHGGKGAVQSVCLRADPHGRAGPTACHLARCATKSLSVDDPSPGLLESACTIHTLTHLDLNIYDSECSLTPLGALRQLPSLSMFYHPTRGQEDVSPAWRLPLPALTRLQLVNSDFCTVNLDGCSALRELSVSEGPGPALAASRRLPHLTRLDFFMTHDVAVPWQHLPAVRELVLLRKNEDVLEGATHLTSLSSLHVDCTGKFSLPPGAWLASVTWLLLEGCACVDPEDLDWTASTTGVEELILWLLVEADPVPTASDVPKIFQWVRWAARLPRLRREEL